MKVEQRELLLLESSFFVAQSNRDCQIRLFHQNIAGLLNKLNNLEICLDNFQKNWACIDIVCLSETFVKSGNEANISLKHFKLADFYSRSQVKRGGVCILVRNGIEFIELPLCKKLAMDKHFECCGTYIPTLKIIILCIYRTPNSDLNIFFDKLNLILNDITKKSNKKVIITGDLNIDILKNNAISSRLHDIVLNYNLIFHIVEPTRQKSCIDHMISNIENAKGEVHSLYLSDHNTGQTLSIPVANKVQSLEYWYIQKRKYGQKNFNLFLESLSSLKWTEVTDEQNLNDAFNVFHDMFCLFFNLCFPIERYKVKANGSSPTWITKGIRKSSKQKRNLRYNCYKKNTTLNKNKYKCYSTLLRKCIEYSQRKINHAFISSAKNKCKAAWDIIKSKTDSTKSWEGITAVESNNKTLFEPSQIAEAFNTFFIDLTSKAHRSDFDTGTRKSSIPMHNHSMYLKPCHSEEVVKIIKSLKNTMAVGFDNIPTKVVKICAHVIAPIMQFLINLSFTEGRFPDRLKQSIVRPLHKKGDKRNMNNYRPITLVPIFSKIFEKVMHCRLACYLDKFHIINEEQNGFRKGKSTTLAAYSLISKVIEGIDKKKLVSVIFFDMSKAFDYVNHVLLLNKCENYGMRGPILEWLSSYLSKRTQCVEISALGDNQTAVSHKSPYLPNNCGVPQGSVLGPLLFLLYINDLPSMIRHNCVLFADDVSVVISGKPKLPIIDHSHLLNAAAESIVDWLDRNNLCANLNKTKYINFRNHSMARNKYSVECRGQLLDETDEYKFLGLVVDQHCNWKSHVHQVCSKLNRFVFALKRLRRTSSEKTALTAYHGYVESVLRYGLLLWGNSTNINYAFIAQKKCVRALSGIEPLDSCRPIFKNYKLLTLTGLYIMQIGIFVKEHGTLFTKFDQNAYFKGVCRDPTRLKMTACRTALYLKNCNGMTIKVYNKIPQDIRELPLNYFKIKLQKWLIGHCFYDLKEYFAFKK